MAETWARLMLADGAVVLNDDGRMILVDSGGDCCPGEYCADVRCIMPACLNVDVCGIRFCRCFTYKSSAEGPATRWKILSGEIPGVSPPAPAANVFGRYKVHVDLDCDWVYGSSSIGPGTPRLNVVGYVGCGCTEGSYDFTAEHCTTVVNTACNGAAVFFLDHESENPENPFLSHFRVTVEVKIVDSGTKIQCRVLATSNFCFGFTFVLFEGESVIPEGWIDGCGRPTFPLTLSNLLDSCDWCGEDQQVSPLGYTYGPAAPHPTFPSSCGVLGYTGSAIIAGVGGTVTIGKLDDDPVSTPCAAGTECPDEGLEAPCDEGDCDDCDSWGLPSSVVVSGLSSVDCSDMFGECPGCGFPGDSVVLNAQFFGSTCDYFSDWYGCPEGGPLQVSIEATACGDWTLYVVGDFGYWIGTKDWDDGDPTGVYTKTGGSSPGPATLTVS